MERHVIKTVSCREAYELMCRLTAEQGAVRNLHLDIRLEPWLVETELFPGEALAAYSAWNLSYPSNQRCAKNTFQHTAAARRGIIATGCGQKSTMWSIV